MAAEPLRFGALVLPNEPWADLLARWRRLDDAGLDSLWSCDHFSYVPGEPWFEAWTGLAGLASATTHATVGLLVGAIVSRSPVMYVKQAITVDHLSGGRLELGLGAGGRVEDQAMWGVDEWSSAERTDRFVEYVDMVDHLSRNMEASLDGRWYRTTGARLHPGFVDGRRPRLLLAAHGRKALATAARHADTWNTFGPTPDDARKARDTLFDQCRAIGRDPGEIRLSALVGLVPGSAWTTPAEFEDMIVRWHDEGFTEFIFYDPPYSRPEVPKASPAAIDEILSTSIPRLRAALSG